MSSSIRRYIDGRRLGLYVRLIPYERVSPEGPQHIAIFHIHGIHRSFRTFLPRIDDLLIPTHCDATNEACADRVTPQLLSLLIEMDELAIRCTDEPAAVRLHVEHLAAVKAHAVIVPPCHVAQGDHIGCV